MKHAGDFYAGISAIDITPPPNLPSFMYSLAAKRWRVIGHQTRLRARAVVIEDQEGERIAIVTSDLGCSSLMLNWLVAECLSADTGLTVENILFAATHTHSGPAGFASSAFYNRMAASDPRSRYDPDLARFLADRIATLLEQACDDLKPARVAIHRTTLQSLTRNRSKEAFEANRDDELKRELNATGGVNADLVMIRVDHKVGARLMPRGALAVFAGHPTVIGPGFRHWHGDVFGLTSWMLEKDYSIPNEDRSVFALANGAVGDVSFKWGNQSHEEAVRLATRFAVGAGNLYDRLAYEGDVHDADVAHAYREVSLRSLDDGSPEAISHPPRMGTPAAGGAEDGRSFAFPFIAREGIKSLFRSLTGQAKQMFLWPFQGLLFKDSTWPDVAPFQLVRIGDTVIAAAPYEMTSMAGRRLQHELARHMQAPANDAVVVVSLANDYHGYCSTPEEYDAQHYEGASTIRGKNTLAMIRSQMIRVADDMNGSLTTARTLPQTRSFRPGRVTRHMPGGVVPRDTSGVVRRNQDLSIHANAVALTWFGLHRNDVAIHEGAMINVERQMPDGAWRPYPDCANQESDLGIRFIVSWLGDYGNQSRWRAQWTWPDEARGETLRLVIPARNGCLPLYSESFLPTPR